ncbi:MAG TPA: APC family permease [Rubrobacter sp.]|nr:APC family permease [Rubrobacter sp.]
MGDTSARGVGPRDGDPGASALLDEDARQLEALGYRSNFSRTMSVAANFSLGFTYLSPLVGVYTLFAFVVSIGGPAAVWTYPIAMAGQLLVALVFAEVLSQYPIAGGPYPWALRLWGRHYAWITGWVYAWALLITIAGVAYGAGQFGAALFGVEASPGWDIAVALVLLAIAAAINFSGTKNLSRAVTAGFAAEIVGVAGVGLYLIIFGRQSSFGVLFDTFGTQGDGSYLSAFLAAGLGAVFLFFGFEACGDLAEEVPNASRSVPRATLLTILVGGSMAILSMVGFILAIPDLGAVVSGDNADPIGTVLGGAFGAVGSKVVIVIALIAFLSCTLSLQAAASRLIYAYARDGMVAGSGILGRFDDRLHIPPAATATAAIIPVLVVLLFGFSPDALTLIISFAVLAIYVAFQLVVFAALVARLRGWRPAGKWTLGGLGLVVNVGALVYGVAAAVNLAYPRTPGVPWYQNYSVLLGTLVVLAVGLVYLVAARPADHLDVPAGDAIPDRGR